RAHALLRVRDPDVGAGRRDAARAAVVRDRREARVHRRRPPGRDRAREHLHLVKPRVLPVVRARAPDLGDQRRPRPEPRRGGDDDRGLDRDLRGDRRALPADGERERAAPAADRAGARPCAGVARRSLRARAGAAARARPSGGRHAGLGERVTTLPAGGPRSLLLRPGRDRPRARPRSRPGGLREEPSMEPPDSRGPGSPDAPEPPAAEEPAQQAPPGRAPPTGTYVIAPMSNWPSGARLPIPGNAEFAMWLFVELLFAII